MGKNKEPIRSFDSFEDLARAFRERLDLPAIQIGDPSALEQQAEEIRIRAQEVKRWVEQALASLNQMRALSREAQELVQAETKVKESQDYLKKILGHEVPAWRRAAWLGLFEYHLGKEITSQDEVKKIFAELSQDGYLHPVKEGEEDHLRVFKQGYRVASESLFGEPELAELRQLLFGVLRKVSQIEKKNQIDKAQELLSQSELTREEFLGGKPGKFALQIPPEEVEKNGQTFWRGGGNLLVETDGARILPIDATGSLQEAVEEAKKMGVFLLLSSLKFDTPPPLKKLEAEQIRKVHLLWHLIKRGLKAIEMEKRTQSLREEMRGKATITPNQFFLKGEAGLCFVEFQGIWEVKAQNGTVIERIPNLFLLVSRSQEGESVKIRLEEYPPHLAEFLTPCQGQEFTVKGEKFEGVAQPLRAVLQACYGQVRWADFAAQKPDQTE